MNNFKDKVAVITGAASGIGYGIAEKCCQEGMNIVLADIEEDALSLAERKLKLKGASVISVLTDVSIQDDLDNLAQEVVNTYGEVNLLFNNAGVALSTYIWESTLKDWKWLMGVNLWGVIHGIRSFIPIMLEQNTECYIVNTSSLAGLCPGGGIYGITKHGVVSLSESLATQLSAINSKIKVSVLCPGIVKTKILNCERNRPKNLCNNSSEVIEHPEFEKALPLIERYFEQGLAPKQAADIVFQGIRDEIFYILTDKHVFWKNTIRKRMKNILKAFETKNIIIDKIN